MAEPELLTVVVLTYNRKTFLPACLRAIQTQTLDAFQAVVLDNASDDGTEAVVAEFLVDPRFRYFRHDHNIGVAGNYNYALGLAETKYLCVTHDDDVMEPRFLEVLVGALEADPAANLVFCDTDAIDAKGEILKRQYFSSLFGIHGNLSCQRREFIGRYLRGEMNIVCPATLLRTARVRENMLQFRSVVGPGVDTYFWMQLDLLAGGILYVHEVLYRYRLHPGQDSVMAAAVLSTKLFRPGLLLLLRHHAYREARLWRNRFLRDIFIDWSKAAYEYRQDASWDERFQTIRALDLGWILGLLLSLIPRSPRGREFFYQFVIINLFRLDTVIKKIRIVLPLGTQRP